MPNDGYVFTTPVARYMENSFGLYDMYGNVAEWVQDCYHDSYKGAPSNGEAWMTGTCDKTVLRGGSWDYNPVFLRSAFRAAGTAASDRVNGLGFRLVQDN